MWLNRVKCPSSSTKTISMFWYYQVQFSLKFCLKKFPDESDNCIKSYSNCRQPCSLFFHLYFPFMVSFNPKLFLQNWNLKIDMPHSWLFPVDWCQKKRLLCFSQKNDMKIKWAFNPVQPQMWVNRVKRRLCPANSF